MRRASNTFPPLHTAPSSKHQQRSAQGSCGKCSHRILSGHKTLIMVGRYAHQIGSHIQIALDKLEESYRKVA